MWGPAASFKENMLCTGDSGRISILYNSDIEVSPNYFWSPMATSHASHAPKTAELIAAAIMPAVGGAPLPAAYGVNLDHARYPVV